MCTYLYCEPRLIVFLTGHDRVGARNGSMVICLIVGQLNVLYEGYFGLFVSSIVCNPDLYVQYKILLFHDRVEAASCHLLQLLISKTGFQPGFTHWSYSSLYVIHCKTKHDIKMLILNKIIRNNTIKCLCTILC